MKDLFEILTSAIDRFTQKKNFKFIKKSFGKSFEVFFDIGFHKGETTNLANSFFNIKKIFAFEPDVRVIKEKNVKNTKNLVLENIGVGEKNGFKNFNLNTFSSINSFNEINTKSKYSKKKKKILELIYNNKDISSKVNVPIITLNKYCSQKKIKQIDILKIDTEGYELQVLKGLRKKINCVNLILFEHHYDKSLIKDYKYSDIHNFLLKNGFRKIFKTKMLFRNIFEYIYINKKFTFNNR